MRTDARAKFSLVNIGFQMLLFVIAGAVLGAVGLGVGVYLSSFTDRLEGFYKAGALAGALTGFAFVVGREWQRHRSGVVPLGIAAAFGAVVVWIVVSGSELDMPLGAKGITCIAWLVATGILMALLRLRR